ncbi:secreted protein [Rhodopirellula maiorica SM1]|uniref:Secreted protein n=1 Tax=Rhodopirellula maiorica SM1 TaxID=1265738 RepID=M5RHZ1_9BACT|nr:hypothetical protein [Rhodopirellula maiorica]EMI18910.1 secreted protein [Rhodopirellula maiorica SM1]
MLSSSLRRTVFATGLLIVTLGVSIAQPPFDPTSTPPEETTPTETTAEPSPTPNPIESKIRSALKGAPEGVNSSDPLLDDVLGIIKSRGSILDGSSLDPALETPAATAGIDRDANARAAESLLRSARLLSEIEPRDSARTELVAKMRHEAWRLLGEYAPATKQ